MTTLLRLASAPGMAGLLLGLGATAPAQGAEDKPRWEAGAGVAAVSFPAYRGPAQRQAFVLNVVDGFNVAEIADFQGRKVAAVEADIAAATTNVQRQLQLEESPDAEEPFARRELRQFRRKNH